MPDPKFLRRQLVILVLILGTAYLWWQSLRPGRYAEWTEGLRLNDPQDAAAIADQVDWSRATRIAFTSSSDSEFCFVETVHRDHRRVQRLEVYHRSVRTLHIVLDRERDLRLLDLTMADTTYRNSRITPQGDSASFSTRLKDSVATYWIPWYRNALFEPALLAWACEWQSLVDLGDVMLVRYHLDQQFFLQLPMRVDPLDDTTLVLQASGNSVWTLTFDATRSALIRACNASGQCWQRTTPSPIPGA